MINRALARSSVFQELFSYCHADCKSLEEAESALENNLDVVQDLYYFLLALIPALTDQYAELVERNRRRFFLREEDANPNLRLLENRLAQKLRACQTIEDRIYAKKLFWHDNDTLLRALLDEILSSDIYKEYASSEEVSVASDTQFWVDVLQKKTFKNRRLDEYLGDCSIYWSDTSAVVEKVEIEEMPGIDALEEMMPALRESETYQAVRFENSAVEVQKDFALKSLRKSKKEEDFEKVLMPMFKDQEDQEFPYLLLRSAIVHQEKYRQLIDDVLRNWDSERLADSDMLLLQLGVAELFSFPTITAAVTINEYIELAKIYSTGKSASFVNGLLDAILGILRTQYHLGK